MCNENYDMGWSDQATFTPYTLPENFPAVYMMQLAALRSSESQHREAIASEVQKIRLQVSQNYPGG